jgi:hypothetical protein
MKSADEWPEGWFLSDENKSANIRGVSGDKPATYGKVDNTLTFEQTNYLVLVNTRGGNIAFRAWKVQFTYPNFNSPASSVYTRVSGTNRFVAYGKMQGGGRYAARLRGRRYGNDKTDFRATIEATLAKESYSVSQIAEIFAALLRKNPNFFATGTIDDVWKLILQGGIAGIPEDQMAIAADSVNNKTTGGGSGGGRPKDKNGPAEQPTLPAPVVKIVTRMPRGYAGRGAAASARPQMVQRYTKPAEGDAKAVNLDDVFTFRYVPQGIKYSGLGSEWIEIPRAEDIPFVDWARWQLMKVSFSFIIANDRTETGGRVVPDGLESSVDSQIEQLRRMAQRKNPVMLFNFDDMLSFQLRRGAANRTSPNMEL